MFGMKTETRRGLVAAGAALIALVTLAILSPTPQLAIYWLVTTYFPSTPPGPMAVTAGAIGAQVAGAATDALMALVPESLSLGAAIGLGIGIGLASFGIGFVAA
jgi:hypothetical protein